MTNNDPNTTAVPANPDGTMQERLGHLLEVGESGDLQAAIVAARKVQQYAEQVTAPGEAQENLQQVQAFQRINSMRAVRNGRVYRCMRWTSEHLAAAIDPVADILENTVQFLTRVTAGTVLSIGRGLRDAWQKKAA